MTSIYLAGKIAKGDWRHEIVGLRGAWGSNGEMPESEWPIMRAAVFGLDYTGPYFMSDDHGCGHGSSTHGCGEDGLVCYAYPAPKKPDIVRLCQRAIKRSDVFFAWLDELTAYGTLVEIGYATALGKRVIIGRKPSKLLNQIDDMWFAFDSAAHVIPADSPIAAVRQAVDFLADIQVLECLESPIERMFWIEHSALGLVELQGLIPQYPVLNGRYRLDFALPDRKVAIELDGYAYHSSKDAFVKDRARQRDLEAAGWRVIRFAGTEVTTDAAACVRQAAAAVRSYVP